MTPPARPVAVIIGTGLIGASIGSALSGRGYHVHLRDRKMAAYVVLVRRGDEVGGRGVAGEAQAG